MKRYRPYPSVTDRYQQDREMIGCMSEGVFQFNRKTRRQLDGDTVDEKKRGGGGIRKEREDGDTERRG